jgi:hypothetical protein
VVDMCHVLVTHPSLVSEPNLSRLSRWRASTASMERSILFSCISITVTVVPIAFSSLSLDHPSRQNSTALRIFSLVSKPLILIRIAFKSFADSLVHLHHTHVHLVKIQIQSCQPKATFINYLQELIRIFRHDSTPCRCPRLEVKVVRFFENY